jgi:hypothetical protein
MTKQLFKYDIHAYRSNVKPDVAPGGGACAAQTGNTNVSAWHERDLLDLPT